jgi:hypothetical protein
MKLFKSSWPSDGSKMEMRHQTNLKTCNMPRSAVLLFRLLDNLILSRICLRISQQGGFNPLLLRHLGVLTKFRLPDHSFNHVGWTNVLPMPVQFELIKSHPLALHTLSRLPCSAAPQQSLCSTSPNRALQQRLFLIRLRRPHRMVQH